MLVELVILLPIVLLLVFGVIEFGIGFNSKISLNQGVRESARAAAVANYDGGEAACTSVAGNGAKVVCLTKERAELSGTRVAAKVIVPSGVEVGDDLTVCGSFALKSVTGIFAPFIDDRFLHAKTTMRVEELPSTGTFSSAQDAALPGDNWGWCS